MPQPQFEIEIEGLEVLVKRLNDPRLTRSAMTGILARARSRGAKQAVKRISGGTGIAERSIFAVFDRQRIEVRIGTHIRNRDRAASIERGRPRGELPNTAALARWMAAEGIQGISPSDMAHQIRRQGTEGKKFIQGTFEDLQAQMPRYVRDAAKRIKRAWERKHVGETLDIGELGE